MASAALPKWPSTVTGQLLASVAVQTFLNISALILNAPPSKIQSCIESIGIGFLFAPLFHPSMKNVASVRKSIGIKTVFNKVGPLSNPWT